MLTLISIRDASSEADVWGAWRVLLCKYFFHLIFFLSPPLDIILIVILSGEITLLTPVYIYLLIHLRERKRKREREGERLNPGKASTQA